MRVEPPKVGASAGDSPRSPTEGGRVENARAMPLRAEGGGGGTKNFFKFSQFTDLQPRNSPRWVVSSYKSRTYVLFPL